MHGISRLGDRWGLSALSRAMDLCGRLVYSASIPGKASIGENVFFHHGGLGVVINAAAVIERDCEIGVHVVLGGRAPQRGAPHLERGVIAHAGAKIIGPIRVGAGAVIAANAVVLEDVPPRCLVAGVPASIKRRDIDNSRYRHDAPISDAKL
jgi:serine O-acetyltransferase